MNRAVVGDALDMVTRHIGFLFWQKEIQSGALVDAATLS
jgi:hypothetical protein